MFLSKKADDTLDHQVHRKSTYIDRYLHAEWHHHPAQKQSTFNSLVHSFRNLWQRTFTDRNHLKLALQKNGHDKKDIIKIINKYTNKTTVFDTTRRKDPIHFPICQTNNKSNWQDFKQTQYPNYLQTQKDSTNLKKSYRSKTSIQEIAPQEYIKYLVPCGEYILEKSKE